jgi:hypothetical protein
VVAVGECLAKTRRGIGNRIRQGHADPVEAFGSGKILEKGAGSGRV